MTPSLGLGSGLATLYIYKVIEKISRDLTQLQLLAQWYRAGLLIVGSQFLTRLVTRFENLDFMRNLLFPLLKNFKSVVDERGHRLRSESPLTFLLCAAPKCYLLNTFKMISKEMSTQANLKTQELTANYYENYANTLAVRVF